MNKNIHITFNTDSDKISRIIEIETYLTGLIISNRGGYQPHDEDEHQVLREEMISLRKEVGILDENGSLIQPPSDQVPPPNIAAGING